MRYEVLLLFAIFVGMLIVFYREKQCQSKQDDLREHLSKVADILEANNVEYWIDYGTLLGAMREGDVIPGDNDTDTSIRIESFEQLKSLQPQFEKLGLNFEHIQDSKVGLNFVEIVDPVKKIHTDIALRYTQDGNLVDPADTPKGTREQTVPVDDVFPLDKNGASIGGRVYPIPGRAWKILKFYYGNDCMHRRTSKHAAVD